MAKRVLISLSNRDCDLTEVSIPWKYFRNQGLEVTFSTEEGAVAETDPLLITGVVFGKLGATPEAIAIYRELQKDSAFRQPIPYSEIRASDYDALMLHGGHAKGMRQYLESTLLQSKVLEFWSLGKIIGAICHGPIVLARTIDPETGKSILYGKRVTALTKRLERMAFYLTFWKVGAYYRTYPEYVEDEIARVLQTKQDFIRGGGIWKPFYVEDGLLITARWPNDAHLFAQKLVEKMASF